MENKGKGKGLLKVRVNIQVKESVHEHWEQMREEQGQI